MNSDPTKPLIRCLGDGASENNNTFPEQEKNKNYKNNVLINVEYQRLQKFRFFSNN